MSPRYARRELEPRESLAAALASGLLALGVGAVAFYLVRLAMARDPVGATGDVLGKDVAPTEG